MNDRTISNFVKVILGILCVAVAYINLIWLVCLMSGKEYPINKDWTEIIHMTNALCVAYASRNLFKSIPS